MLKTHKPKCEDNNITILRISTESHIYRKKKHFYKNTLCFRIYADFEADNKIDKSSIGNKRTNVYKQNPVLNGYHIQPELEDVLKSGYYESPLGYDNVDWFVDEVVKLKNQMAVYFKKNRKGIILTEEDDEDFKNENI